MLAHSRTSRKAESDARDALPYLRSEVADFFGGVAGLNRTAALVVVVLNLVVPRLRRVSVAVRQVGNRAPSKQVLPVMSRERRGRVVELVVLIQILNIGLSSGVQGLVDEHDSCLAFGARHFGAAEGRRE